MKIAVWHNLPGGGGKRALYHHVKGLVEAGHHLEVWRPDLADESFLPLHELCREHIVRLEVSDFAAGRSGDLPRGKGLWQAVQR